MVLTNSIKSFLLEAAIFLLHPKHIAFQMIQFISRNSSLGNIPLWKWWDLFHGFLLGIPTGVVPLWSHAWIKKTNLCTICKSHNSFIRDQGNAPFCEFHYSIFFCLFPFPISVCFSFSFFFPLFDNWLQDGLVPPESLEELRSWATWWSLQGWIALEAWVGRSRMAQMMLWASSSLEGPLSSLSSTTILWDSTSVWPEYLQVAVASQPVGRCETSQGLRKSQDWAWRMYVGSHLSRILQVLTCLSQPFNS